MRSLAARFSEQGQRIQREQRSPMPGSAATRSAAALASVG
jgi:hypothetical protein